MEKKIEISMPKGYSFKEVRDGKAVFEKVLPTSWEEFCKAHPITAGECFIDANSDFVVYEDKDRNREIDANVIKSPGTANAFLALNKLIYLRDCYRQGWVPDWRNVKQKKFGIGVFHDNVNKDSTFFQQHVLSFQTKEVRNMFLDKFKGLIEEAKELL